MIKNYNQYNESIRDHMKPKSDEDVIKSLDGLNTFDRMKKVRQYKLSNDYLPPQEEIEKELYNEMLMKSFSLGFVGGIKKAIELGADFNKLSLSIACSDGHSDVVKFLVENGKDVNEYDGHYTPLGRAIQHGHLDTVKTLIDLGADTDSTAHVWDSSTHHSIKKYTMVGLAEHFNRPEIAEYLRSIK